MEATVAVIPLPASAAAAVDAADPADAVVLAFVVEAAVDESETGRLKSSEMA